ncbi:hypothetical protein ABZU32_20645 [Sphaerisporangium sp. NPDC005288]|uniref:hypothetical protein n=1 Tax=Sphaerisporangium sp. NPDC005288 TaxID=3155114 RepID=UPI0033B90F93
MGGMQPSGAGIGLRLRRRLACLLDAGDGLVRVLRRGAAALLGEFFGALNGLAGTFASTHAPPMSLIHPPARLFVVLGNTVVLPLQSPHRR